MALFGDKDEPMANSSNTLSSPGQVNMVGQGTVVEGLLHTESDIRVSGRVEGTLRVEGKAMIAQEGTIDGELTASSADVAGTVQGEVHISERLVLKGSARIDGNIETNRLVVEEGALFTGECKMGEEATDIEELSDDHQGAALNGVTSSEDDELAEETTGAADDDATTTSG